MVLSPLDVLIQRVKIDAFCCPFGLEQDLRAIVFDALGPQLSIAELFSGNTLVMLAIAGATALLIGVVGIYGVISYSVSQRRREIGIRVALGAPQAELTRMFVVHGFVLALIGVARGLVGAVVLTPCFGSLLFDVSPLDPLTYAAVSLGLLMAAMVASYIPALRTMGVDPIEALRAE